MTDPIFHDTFTVERRIAASPERVFEAFADKEAKSAWFGANVEGYTVLTRDHDVRTGGHERAEGRWASGNISDFRAQYHEVTAPSRLVYTYEMLYGGRRLSFSLATVEIFPDGAGARLKITEQGAYYVERDAAARKHGTEFGMDSLKLAVETAAAA